MPTFIGLGTLGERNPASLATAISDDGHVVVGFSTPENGIGIEAFRWTLETGVVGLGDLPGGGFQSSAMDVSADGSVVVGIGASGETGRSGSRWTSSEGMMPLSNMSMGFHAANATAISADGSVIVGSGSFNEGQPAVPFRWTSTAGATDLGDLPATTSGIVTSMSNDGAVVIGMLEDGEASDPFRWTAEAGFVRLGLLAGETSGYASTLSPDGSLALGISGQQAVIWSTGPKPAGLGVNFFPWDVSEDTLTIVGAAAFDERWEAVIWRAGHGLQTISDLLQDEFGFDLGGWSLEEARGISADGTVITGRGVNPAGHPEAWLAIVPEPITLVLLGTGVIMICRRRPASL
jgi:probable HAF family extracellular repeat protein